MHPSVHKTSVQMNYLATLLTLVLGSASLAASIDPVDVVVVADPTSKTVVIRSAMAVPHATKITLLSQRGDQLYTADVAAGAYVSLRFPVTALPAAKYVLHFTDDIGRTTLPFATDANQLVKYSFAEGLRTIFPRVDVKEARTLVLSYPATEQSKAYRMTLRSADGKTVFSDRVDATASVRKTIQLESLHAGIYTVAFAANNKRLHSTAIELR